MSMLYGFTFLFTNLARLLAHGLEVDFMIFMDHTMLCGGFVLLLVLPQQLCTPP
jgi:hypothetical protein